MEHTLINLALVAANSACLASLHEAAEHYADDAIATHPQTLALQKQWEDACTHHGFNPHAVPLDTAPPDLQEICRLQDALHGEIKQAFVAAFFLAVGGESVA